ncbi:MAG: hypothetical protein R2755_26980 [Acidimicrobiales bacterium]
MRVKMILPALTEATSPLFRPIKYALFPPLGLASLAAHCHPDDEVTICDEHVEPLRLDDRPDLVVIQAYITSARRAYEVADHYRARGVRVAIGGLHPPRCPTRPPLTPTTSSWVPVTTPGRSSWPTCGPVPRHRDTNQYGGRWWGRRRSGGT